MRRPRARRTLARARRTGQTPPVTENLTHPTDAAVGAFLDAVEHPVRRRDGWRLHDLLARLTGEEAVMWGPTIVGFGRYTYAYDSGRTGEAAAASFSPRKAATTIYLPEGTGPHAERLARLGPHRASKACVYVTNLDRVDVAVLEEMLRASYETVTCGVMDHHAEG